MASIRLGSVIADIRGSVGDETYGRNQGGLYVRQRVSPSQPPSDERDARQAAMTALSQAWSGTLNQTQRDTWTQYGRQHPLPDRFGRPRDLAGICHFIRCNCQRYRDESAITASTAPTSPPPAMPGFTAAATALHALAVTGTITPDWTGVYHLLGTHDGQPTWKHPDHEQYIWKQPGTEWWLITHEIDAYPADRFVRIPGPIGDWIPVGSATGTPTTAYNAAQSSVTITPAPAIWVGPATSTRLFAYAGEEVTTGRSYYRTPYRYIGRNTYDGADWTLDPWLLPHWTTLAPAKRTFLRVAQVLPDGATSIAGHAYANS